MFYEGGERKGEREREKSVYIYIYWWERLLDVLVRTGLARRKKQVNSNTEKMDDVGGDKRNISMCCLRTI